SRSGVTRTRAGARPRRWGGCSDERADTDRRGRGAAGDSSRRATRALAHPQGAARARHRRRDRRRPRALAAMSEHAWERPLARARWLRGLIERPSPLAKQLPTVFLLVVGIVIVVIADGIDFTSL